MWLVPGGVSLVAAGKAEVFLFTHIPLLNPLPEVFDGLGVYEGRLFPVSLLKDLALVPELNDCLGIGVERSDGRRHAAGK